MKTLTLTFTDSLLSPIGLSVLSGAGLFHAKTLGVSHFHMNSLATMDKDGKIDLTDAIAEYGKDANGDYIAKICVEDAPIYIMKIGAEDVEEDDDEEITGALVTGDITVDGQTLTVANAQLLSGDETTAISKAMNVMVDYYVDLPGENVYEADITTDEFAGYYYVEASVLVRDQATGKDLPGNLTIPNAKLQSNFTITMASTGDPSELMRLAA